MPHPPTAAIVAAAAVLLALAGCTPADPDPGPDPASSTAPPSSSAPEGPAAPVEPIAASCLAPELVAAATGVTVAAGTAETPPAGAVDPAVPLAERELCTYDLEGGARLGFSPLVDAVDVEAMDAALAPVVQHDDCAAVSGYLVGAQDTYYVWTGATFAALYTLVGDPSDPEVWLARIADEAGLCGSGIEG